MTAQPPTPSQRISPIPFPTHYELPSRPDDTSPAVQDAYRQSRFLLGRDLDLFGHLMNLQLRIVADSHPSRYRRHPYAAIMGLWSRAFLYLADGCTLVTRGAYASCLPLVRTACECLAAQDQLRREEMDQFLEWAASSPRTDAAHKALEVEMGPYFAGGALASDERLRSVYRPAGDLGRPNFGATLLQVGPESNNRRLTLTFADRAFHLGWAELVLGWLLALAERQLAVAVAAEGIFALSDEVRAACDSLAAEVDTALARSDRCRIEEVEEEGYKRYLVHNFRRTSGSIPKRVLL
jgi:hypothetical protein